MSKLKLVSRSINTRKVNGRTRFEKAVRTLNSVSELVGEQVELTEGESTTTAEVNAVEVDEVGNVQLELVTGDQVELSADEAGDLITQGEVTAEDLPQEPETELVVEVEDEPVEDFTVTREVVTEDGVKEVTTKVEAIDELDAETKVKLLDSRRGRNSRNYNSRRTNSDTPEATWQGEGIYGNPKTGSMYTFLRESEWKENNQNQKYSEFITKDTEYMLGVQGKSKEEIKAHKDMLNKWRDEHKTKRQSNSVTEVVEEVEPVAPESTEFKVVRNCMVNGKSVRKVASVTAPSLDEAINAVENADKTAAIEADGYQELVEEQPKPTDVEEVATVTINSDVEIPEGDSMAEIEQSPSNPESTEEEPIPSATPEETPEEAAEVAEEVDRESNSFKGVSEYVKRAYGVDL